MLQNGSFEEGWTDLPPEPGYLINQNPNGWTLTWVSIDSPLYDSGDLSKGVPECVHKLARQLPPNEQLGAENALILDGGVTYKIFHSGAPFGAELRQTVSGLEPGSKGKLTVPILAVLNGEGDEYGAESGAWIDTVGTDNSSDWHGRWANARVMGDRNWYIHEVDFTVPGSGSVQVIIRVKSKWPRPKDFFIDNVTMEAVAATAPIVSGASSSEEVDSSSPIPPEPESEERIIAVSAPAGLKVELDESDEADTVVIKVPTGYRVNIQ